MEYPFDAEWILKKKSIKKGLLNCEDKDFIEKKIAILGGSTTNDIKNVLELFLLNYGIKWDGNMEHRYGYLLTTVKPGYDIVPDSKLSPVLVYLSAGCYSKEQNR